MATLDFNIGARVHCGEETCGELMKVVVDPHRQRITDLIVRRGFLRKKDRVLPVSDVERTAGEDIYLSISSGELERQPEYHESEFTSRVSGWERNTVPYTEEEVTCYVSPWGRACLRPVVPALQQRVRSNIPSSLAVIQRGTPVFSATGQIGTLDHMLVDSESGEIAHLVLRRGSPPEYPIVPAEAIQEVTEDGIRVTMTDEALEELPHYQPRSGKEMEAELRERLAAGSYDFVSVKAQEQEGVMRLTGSVADMAGKRQAEAAARSVMGVVGVENALDVDTATSARVVAALAQDPMTHLADIDPTSERGIVTLHGRVDTPEIRAAAQQVAEKQPGVLSVVNALEVAPDAESPKLIPWYFGRTWR